MFEFNIRDHKKRSISEAYMWCQQNCTGRWDLFSFADRGGVKHHMRFGLMDNGKVFCRPSLSLDDLREPRHARNHDGEFWEKSCERGGRRNLALIKQFVKLKAVLADEADAKAFRKWLRG